MSIVVVFAIFVARRSLIMRADTTDNPQRKFMVEKFMGDTTEASIERTSSWNNFVQFWRIFFATPQCWMVLCRNLIPVVGVYAFDWSLELGLFNIWYDGAVGLIAVAFALLTSIVIESAADKSSRGNTVIISVMLIGMLFGFALPYVWLAVSKYGFIDVRQMVVRIQQSPSLLFVFGAVAFGQLMRAFANIKTDRALRNSLLMAFNLVGRGFALLLISPFVFSRLIIPLLALALTYVEVLPDVLRAMRNSTAHRKNADLD